MGDGAPATMAMLGISQNQTKGRQMSQTANPRQNHAQQDPNNAIAPLPIGAKQLAVGRLDPEVQNLRNLPAEIESSRLAVLELEARHRQTVNHLEDLKARAYLRACEGGGGHYHALNLAKTCPTVLQAIGEVGQLYVALETQRARQKRLCQEFQIGLALLQVQT